MIRTVRITGLERLELERLRDRMETLLSALQEASLSDEPATPGAWSPPADVCETPDAVTVRVELPGVRPEQVNITIANAALRISGEKSPVTPAASGSVSYQCSERFFGRFSRVLQLHWTVDVHAAHAELTDGLLILTLPKRAERRGVEYKISINSQTAEN